MIYGLDPGVRKLALFGVPYNVGDSSFTHWEFKTPQNGRGFEVTHMRCMLERYLESDPEPIIFCEEPVVAGRRNLRTTIQIAETVGMVLALEHPVYLVPVSTWKKETTGSGNASKDRVSEWLREEYKQYFAACEGNQDICDAAAMAIYGRGVVARSALGASPRSRI